MPKPLLVEVGCEEIPARLVSGMARQFAAALGERLDAAGLVATAEATPAWTPRRLIVTVADVFDRQADREEQVIGPPAKIGVASDGSYTSQAIGFAAKLGLAAGDLTRVPTPKGEYVAVTKRTPGRPALDVVAEAIAPAFAAIELPRSMKWRSDDAPRFIRPVRWLLALLGDEVVPAKLGPLLAGRTSQGHRTLSKGSFNVNAAKDFPAAWRKEFVLCDPLEREAAVMAGVAATGLKPRTDTGLFDTLVNLVEFPGVVAGSFDASYLSALPEEVLVTVMRDHQKYFAVEDASGKLLPHFLAVTNLDQDREGLIRHGNERVLRARFKDALFFWETDRKTSLEARLPMLEQVTFQAKLGSYRQKSERMIAIADWLAARWPASDSSAAHKAATLAKCDLTTELVKEFTELQGVMGGRYAEAEGMPSAVATAIADQYAWEKAPRTLEGTVVSLADKFDTIAGMFAIGEIPSGSSDPFGLRRQGNGIVRTLIEKKLPLSLAEACEKALAIHGTNSHFRGRTQTDMDLTSFFGERLGFYLRENAGYAYDTTAAVLAVGADDVLDAQVRARAVTVVRGARPQEFARVAAALKRMRNIVKKEGGLAKWQGVAVDTAKLADAAEVALHDAVAGVNASDGYEAELAAISQLWEPLDRFFNDVRVNAEDPAIRANRLALLAWAIQRLSRVADFSEIVVAAP